MFVKLVGVLRLITVTWLVTDHHINVSFCHPVVHPCCQLDKEFMTAIVGILLNTY
jgi:hypothetical protein